MKRLCRAAFGILLAAISLALALTANAEKYDSVRTLPDEYRLDVELGIYDYGSIDALADQSRYKSVKLPAGTFIRVTAWEDIGYLEVTFFKYAADYTIWADGDEIERNYGFVHDCTALPEGSRNLQLYFPNGAELSEITAYRSGEPPAELQLWNPPLDNGCDVLAFPTHADDDVLFMGALIASARSEGRTVQACFITNHYDTAERTHEALDGLWALGVRNYPIIGSFPDLYSRSLRYAESQYDTDAMRGYIVESIRRFKPLVVLGHDFDGEYGHGAHMLSAKLLSEAVTLTDDPNYYPESYEKYGGYTPCKLFIHFYKQNSFTFDAKAPSERLGGKSPFEIAEYAYTFHKTQHKWDFAVTDYGTLDCRKWGLYFSTVGYDVEANDIFCNIPIPVSETINEVLSEYECQTFVLRDIVADSAVIYDRSGNEADSKLAALKTVRAPESMMLTAAALCGMLLLVALIQSIFLLVKNRNSR